MIKKCLAAVLIVTGLSAGALRAQESGWSWDTNAPASANAQGPGAVTNPPAPVSMPGSPDAAVPASGKGEAFSWNWEESDTKPGASVHRPSTPAPLPAPAVAPDPASAAVTTEKVSVQAYKELLQDNFELRKKVTDATAEKLEADKRKEELERRLADLEKAVAEYARQSGPKPEKPAAPEDLDKVVEADSRVPSVEGEKQLLEQEVKEAQAAREDRKGTEVKPGSDLFRELEQDNLRLKKRLADVETEKNKAIKAQDEMLQEHRVFLEEKKDLEKQLAGLKSAEKQKKKTVDQLVERAPQLEKDLADLQQQVASKDAALAKRDQDLETLKQEIDRRENRLVKAERTAALLDKTKEEVRRVSEKEKRDMHYNMAAVYAREGRFREAEQEYLRALRIDPTDAESHYNLGILYDEEFHDKRRAASHYRRYLKLRPNASDVDAVKDWLINLDVE